MSFAFGLFVGGAVGLVLGVVLVFVIGWLRGSPP